jgi:hypothetical protein
MPMAAATARSRGGSPSGTFINRNQPRNSATVPTVRSMTTVSGSAPPPCARAVQIPTIANDVAKARS